MPENIYFWEFTSDQKNLFIAYAASCDIDLPSNLFKEFDNKYYIEQSATNLLDYEDLLFAFDDQDGPGGTYSFGEHYWSASLVPPALWP